MANFKINDWVISNVTTTDSGDVLGLVIPIDMSFAELDYCFSPNSTPEFYEIDDAGKTIGVYKNRKVVSARVSNGVAEVALLVTKGDVDMMETLIAKVDEQATQIAEQAKMIEDQSEQILTQDETIASQMERIQGLEEALAKTNAQLENTEAMLTAMEEGIANA